jgi:hypothetical protein
MAMELFVLSDRELNSIAEWQAAIEAQGFALKLDDTDFETHSGFLPAKLNGKLTGFECDHWAADEFMRENSDINFGHNWRFVLAFRWIGDFNELLAVSIAAAAYATATSGVVLNDQEGILRTAVEALDEARHIERDMPRLEAIARELRQP